MKKTAKFLVPVMLGVLIFASILWYLFLYDRNFTRDTLLNQARYHDLHGNARLSSWFYDSAYNFSGHDENVAIELANQYKHDGNYTKAELTLTEAIHNGPTPELYTALCRTYVEQDKLLDAVKLLDLLGHPEIKAQLDAQRPPAPDPVMPAGFYSEYIQVELKSDAKYILYSMDDSYPSIRGQQYLEPIDLPSGESAITAIAVGEDGLVSPLAVLNYTITGVVEEVQFTDNVVEAAIREIIGIPTATILSNQLWEITEFTVPEGAASLEDLRKLPNLTTLHISDANLSSLSFLTSLLKLETLEVRNCNFLNEEMANIAVLPALQKLTLASCNLSSIDALSNASALRELDLSGNTLRNLEPLKTMPSITRLSLQHNAINDLGVVGSLDELVYLDVSYNDIRSLDPLEECLKLTELAANNNNIDDLEGLEDLKELQSLSLNDNDLEDISSLTENKALKVLRVASNDLTDITCLSELKSLENLDFSGNHVEELPEFAEGCPLLTIDGSYNQLTSLDNLSVLQSLTHVYMDYNLLTDISELENCYCLVQINVFGNAIEEVSMLREKDIIVNYDPTVSASFGGEADDEEEE